MKSFMGITGHFVLDWTMQLVMLACSRNKGSHTADNIREHFEEFIATFDISGKMSHIVTDNVANMIKAFQVSLPGSTEGEQQDSSESEDIDNEGTQGSEPNTCDIDEALDHLPEHHRYFSHTIQLVVRDGLSSAQG